MSETNKTVFERRVIQHPNVGVFVSEIVAAVKDGWEIDEQNPVGIYGFHFEAHLLKDESLISKKISAADNAANARSAKKLKAEAAKPTEETKSE